MNCDNPKCNHPQEDHMKGEFNCTFVTDYVYSTDKKDFGTIAMKVPALQNCQCEKFKYPPDYA